jgi:hypothetical protein
MRKIISLFQRNYDGDRQVRNEIVPGAEWVISGEGIATRKWDGTCCLYRGGRLYRRHEIKAGGKPPPNFEPANEVDETTGKQQGWLPVGDGPEDRWHREALARGHAILDPIDGPATMTLRDDFRDGETYELVGVKVQGNAEGVADGHWLVTHGQHRLPLAPRDFDGIREYLRTADIEGIVWHHADGRMVKIKTRDFGLKRVPRTAAS